MVLSLCEGSATGSISGFAEQITAALAAPIAAPTSRRKVAATPKQPDQKLATEFADRLSAAARDSDTFSKVVDRLCDAKVVSTPTLHTVANLFLGGTRTFKARKPVIEAIIKRQKEDVRFHARGRALDRIGV